MLKSRRKPSWRFYGWRKIDRNDRDGMEKIAAMVARNVNQPGSHLLRRPGDPVAGSWLSLAPFFAGVHCDDGSADPCFPADSGRGIPGAAFRASQAQRGFLGDQP